MRKLTPIVLTLVLTAALLVGCGCTNRNMETTTAPTVLPTNEEVWDTTETTAHPTVETTRPTETFDTGNGPLEDMMPNSDSTVVTTSTEATTDTNTARSRNRSSMGSSR